MEFRFDAICCVLTCTIKILMQDIVNVHADLIFVHMPHVPSLENN